LYLSLTAGAVIVGFVVNHAIALHSCIAGVDHQIMCDDALQLVSASGLC
jgi:hypothetical protein